MRRRPPSPAAPPPAAEERLTQSTEYIFYAGAALFGLRAWAFGFGKAQRERLWAIMLYSIAGLVLLAEVRPWMLSARAGATIAAAACTALLRSSLRLSIRSRFEVHCH